MLWINIKRIAKSGFVNFWRNGFVSFSTISVMVVTLFVIGILFFTSAILDSAMTALKDKIDITVYFLPSAAESDILDLQKSVEALPEVQTATYISADDALANFKAAHADDQSTLAALDELSSNPLGASLNIKANDPSQYEGIATFLTDTDSARASGSIIDRVNYAQNKTAIDKLTKLIDSGTGLGFALAIIFALISFMITFNTVRLAIFVARDEIAVMKLVGASNAYVRGPFVVTGVMYGLVGALFTLFIFYPLTYWLGPRTDNFFTGMNVFTYYLTHFVELFVILVGAGVVIGAVSSYLAVRRYLEV